MRRLDIHEVAKRTGVPASTLRYYEQRGLIASVGRRGLRRVFAPCVLERLALIALWQSSGFSLDEMRRLFGDGGRPRFDRDILAAKADELERRIVELAATRDELRRAAVCPAPTHLDCPNFRRRVEGAGGCAPAEGGLPIVSRRRTVRAARLVEKSPPPPTARRR